MRENWSDDVGLPLSAVDKIYTVSQKNIPAIISRSLGKHYMILIIFGRHIPEKILIEEVI